MKNDDFGDRMKMYEKFETGRKFMPLLPIYARLDGRGFSKFTKGMSRPYDSEMTWIMHETTKALIEKSHATIGYTQSDEISLLFYAEKAESGIFFDAKIQKMCSVLAGLASSFFMLKLFGSHFDDEYLKRLPHFDCRVYQLPNKTEAANAFLWREQDANKNAISMAAQKYFSSKELHGKNSVTKKMMLWEHGVDFEEYPSYFKNGAFFRRVTELREIDAETWDKIPDSKKPAERTCMRTTVERIKVPPFNTVANRVEVLFDGAKPETRLCEAVKLARKNIVS